MSHLLLNSTALPSPSASAPELRLPAAPRQEEDSTQQEEATKYSTTENYKHWKAQLLDKPKEFDESWNAELKKYQEKSNRGGKSEFTGDERLNSDHINDLRITSGFYTERLANLLPIAQKRLVELVSEDKMKDRKFFELVFECTNLLHKDEEYLKSIKKLFDQQNPDCDEISMTFLVMVILFLPDTSAAEKEIDIYRVTGLIFDDKHAEKGIGHAWIQIGTTVYDAAFTPDGKLQTVDVSKGHYIPIVGQRIRVNAKKLSINRTELMFMEPKSKR